MLNNEREKYEQFWKTFGIQIKFGVYDNYGRDKNAVEDLLMFTSSHENKLTTLDEYVSRMKEEQKYIYYAAGDSVEKIQALPQTELLRDKGYEILYLTDNVDEFAVKVLMRHGDKEFRNVSEGDLGIDTEAEKEETKKLAEENKDMLSFITAALDGKVKETKISDKLKSHPVCISSSGQISLEMEKILNQNPQNEKVKSEKSWRSTPTTRYLPQCRSFTARTRKSSRITHLSSTIRHCSSRVCRSKTLLNFPTRYAHLWLNNLCA